MSRLSRAVRTFAFLMAAFQLAMGAGAPMLEAAYGADAASAAADGFGVRAQPRHAHDGNTCLVCRLLDSPPTIDVERDCARADTPADPVPPRLAAVTPLNTSGLHLSRAPPASLS